MFLLFFILDKVFDKPGEYKLPLKAGKYKSQCYGAQGGEGYDDGKIHSYGGNSAYVYGELSITGSEFTFNVHVGGKGESSKAGPNAGGYNGGGRGGHDKEGALDGNDAPGGGGGTTDIRYGSGMETRIMVAAGGSGAAGYAPGAPGGTLEGRKIGCNNCNYHWFLRPTNFKCDSYPVEISDKTNQEKGNEKLGFGGDGIKKTLFQEVVVVVTKVEYHQVIQAGERHVIIIQLHTVDHLTYQDTQAASQTK